MAVMFGHEAGRRQGRAACRRRGRLRARHPPAPIRYSARMEPIAFGLIGSGWRGEFFERIAAALPDRFRLTGRYSRRVPG